MSRILFTSGSNDWKKFLADGDKQWQTGYSACTLAHCWEAADGFPPEVSNLLGQTTEPLIENLTPVLAVPEFRVPLPGGTRASQNDLLVLARSSAGLVSIVVEGKVKESFGPTVGEWLVKASKGKRKRLRFLRELLGIDATTKNKIRYQLLHRTASALITAEQYHAAAALVLIHSFSEERAGWNDYRAFVHLFGVKATPGVVQRLTSSTSVPLFAAWVIGDCRFLKS